MKYHVVFFALSGYFVSTMHGQVGFMDSTYTWTEIYYYINGHQTNRNTMSAESVILNGKTYNEILFSPEEEEGAWLPTWVYIRYENQKLFQGYSNGEALIFDFSLEVNDTLYPDDGPVYIITGIDSVLLGNGEKRKRLHAECLQGEWGDWTNYWVEGLPSSAGLVDNHSVCAADAGSALLCVWQNDEFLYSNPEIDSCWYVPVPTLEIEPTNVQILANPVESWLNISDPDEELTQVSVYDFIGRKCYQGKDLNINLEFAPQGYYLVSITLKSGYVQSYKILKK
jgi:hypothetical protein